MFGICAIFRSKDLTPGFCASFNPMQTEPEQHGSSSSVLQPAQPKHPPPPPPPVHEQPMFDQHEDFQLQFMQSFCSALGFMQLALQQLGMPSADFDVLLHGCACKYGAVIEQKRRKEKF